MAVPKRKKSHSKTKRRRNFWSNICACSYKVCETCSKAVDTKLQICKLCKITI